MLADNVYTEMASSEQQCLMQDAPVTITLGDAQAMRAQKPARALLAESNAVHGSADAATAAQLDIVNEQPGGYVVNIAFNGGKGAAPASVKLRVQVAPCAPNFVPLVLDTVRPGTQDVIEWRGQDGHLQAQCVLPVDVQQGSVKVRFRAVVKAAHNAELHLQAVACSCWCSQAGLAAVNPTKSFGLYGCAVNNSSSCQCNCV